MKAYLGFALMLATTVGFAQPKPTGKLVQLDGHRLHVNCTGKGSPTVIIENGFDEFSFDWIEVQREVEKFTRICTYDRAGYGWSDPGPMPRTYDQINLDLLNALKNLKEKGPYLLVGHSFGGPVIQNFALKHREEVVGLIFAESVADDHRIVMGKKTARIADFAQGREIPAPHASLRLSDKSKTAAEPVTDEPKLYPPFDRLPSELQKAHLWAMSQANLQQAENSERDWSPEYLSLWLKKGTAGSLGDLPIIVLARERGGYGDDLDLPAEQLEIGRKKGQANLATLSSRGKLQFVTGGHDIQLENPQAVVGAVRVLVEASRKR
jgi:pimeloyl-ACP methyl ester carboxylesterase